MNKEQGVALNAFIENDENDSNFSPKTTKYISLFSGLAFAIFSSGLNNKQEISPLLFKNTSLLVHENGIIYSKQLLNLLDKFNINQPEDLSPSTLLDTSTIISNIVSEIEEKNAPEIMIEKAFEIEPIIENSLEKIDLSKFGFSSTVENGLKELILGLIAQESSFNPNSRSSANALGLFQITPGTYNGFKNKYINDPRFNSIFSGNMDSLLSSVDKQLEFYFLHAYEIQNTFVKSSNGELEKIKNTYFNGDQDIFEKSFLVYVLLNAYNTGGQVFNRSMFGDFNDYLELNFDSDLNAEDSLYLFNELTVFLRNIRGNNYGPQAQKYALNIISRNEIIYNKVPRS